MSVDRAPPVFEPSELGRIPADVLARHDVAGPRYTSYPTAPAWGDAAASAGEAALRRSAERRAPLSVYVHIPFCESLCIYCGCNVVITKQRPRAEQYLERLLREIDHVAELTGADRRETVQVAWGGGTPTYFTPDQIERLMQHIARRFPLADTAEIGIEVDPRVTTVEHVRAIAACGMNRISMGVQDFDPKVQNEIHRVQSFEATRDLILACRESGLASVNVDLVYGLPLQTLAGFEASIDRVLELSPDRVSAFSYAHVPWLKPAQRAFREETLPQGADKFAIFVRLVERLCAAGYEFVGMDHFAKPDNELARASRDGGLWRNFQGFTTQGGTDLVGIGVTSISSLDDAYLQNAKDLAAWGVDIDAGRLATRRGMTVSADDKVRRTVIQDVMCRYRFDPARLERLTGVDVATEFADALATLEPLERDGMLERDDDGGFALTSRGRVFVRNVCMAFDAHLPRGERPVFSRTI